MFISSYDSDAIVTILFIAVLTLEVSESASVPLSVSQKDTRSSAKFNIYVPRDGKYVISVWIFDSLKFASAFTTPIADLTVAILSSPNVPRLSTKLLRFEATVGKSPENAPRPLSPNIFLVHSACPSIFFDASAKAVITEHAAFTDVTWSSVIVPSPVTKPESFPPTSGRSLVNAPSPLSPNMALAHSACPSISPPAFDNSFMTEHAILTEFNWSSVTVPRLLTKETRFEATSGRSPVNAPRPLSPNIFLAQSACPSMFLDALDNALRTSQADSTDSICSGVKVPSSVMNEFSPFPTPENSVSRSPNSPPNPKILLILSLRPALEIVDIASATISIDLAVSGFIAPMASINLEIFSPISGRPEVRPTPILEMNSPRPVPIFLRTFIPLSRNFSAIGVSVTSSPRLIMTSLTTSITPAIAAAPTRAPIASGPMSPNIATAPAKARSMTDKAIAVSIDGVTSIFLRSNNTPPIEASITDIKSVATKAIARDFISYFPPLNIRTAAAIAKRSTDKDATVSIAGAIFICSMTHNAPPIATNTRVIAPTANIASHDIFSTPESIRNAAVIAIRRIAIDSTVSIDAPISSSCIANKIAPRTTITTSIEPRLLAIPASNDLAYFVATRRRANIPIIADIDSVAASNLSFSINDKPTTAPTRIAIIPPIISNCFVQSPNLEAAFATAARETIIATIAAVPTATSLGLSKLRRAIAATSMSIPADIFSIIVPALSAYSPLNLVILTIAPNRTSTAAINARPLIISPVGIVAITFIARAINVIPAAILNIILPALFASSPHIWEIYMNRKNKVCTPDRTTPPFKISS